MVANPSDGDLTIVAAGRELSGWEMIRVTRGIERCPNDFEVQLSDSGGSADVPAQPGDACQVYIGSDLVITGYVDVFNPSINARAHTVRITGRGKCRDLVDCSATYPGGQIVGDTVSGIAAKL